MNRKAKNEHQVHFVDESCKNLAASIIVLAIRDYRFCAKHGYSTKETELFFKSEWCDALLHLCTGDSSFSGEYLLRKLRN